MLHRAASLILVQQLMLFVKDAARRIESRTSDTAKKGVIFTHAIQMINFVYISNAYVEKFCSKKY